MHVSHDGRRLSAPVRTESGLATKVVRALDRAGVFVDDVEVQQPSLDDVFFTLTGGVGPDHPGTEQPRTGGAHGDDAGTDTREEGVA